MFGDVSTTTWHYDEGWAKRLNLTEFSSGSTVFNETTSWYISGPYTLNNPNLNAGGTPPFPVGPEGEPDNAFKTRTYLLVKFIL